LKFSTVQSTITSQRADDKPLETIESLTERSKGPKTSRIKKKKKKEKPEEVDYMLVEVPFTNIIENLA